MRLPAVAVAAFLVASPGIAVAYDVADVRADLVGPARVSAGDEFDYVLTVHNAGPGDAVDTVVVDVLDARSRFVRSDPGCDFVAGQVSCALGTLTPGQGKRVTVTVRIASTLADGTVLRSYALADSAAADDNPGDNASSTAVLVNGLPDLAIEASGPEELLPGERGTYTLTVDNSGTDVSSIVVRARLDPLVRILRAPDGCALDPLLNEVECAGWWVISLTAKAIPAAPPGAVVRMHAEVRSGSRDADASDNEAGWAIRIGSPVADLAMTVKRTATGFEVTITNHGPDAAGAELRGVLAEGVEMGRLPDVCTSRGRRLTCVLDPLVPGTRRTLGFGVLALRSLPAGSLLSNGFSLSAVDADDPDRSDNAVTLEVSVPPAPARAAPRPSTRPSTTPSSTAQPRRTQPAEPPIPSPTARPAAVPLLPEPDDSSMPASDVLLFGMPLISMLVAARLFQRR